MYRSTTALDKAGTELAPLITLTPFCARKRIEARDARHERSSVCEIDVRAAGLDGSSCDVVVLPLKRAGRVDDDIDFELAQSGGEIAAVRIDPDALLRRQPELTDRIGGLARITPADQQTQALVGGQRLGDSRTEEPVAAQHQDAQHRAGTMAGCLARVSRQRRRGKRCARY